MLDLSSLPLKPELLERMPRFMHSPTDPPIKKDFKYYSHKGNVWNNKYLTSKKVLPYYHVPSVKAASQINNLKQRESSEQELQETIRMMTIKDTRTKSHLLLRSRIEERNQLERAAGMKAASISTSDVASDFPATENDHMRTTLHTKLISGRHMIDQNQWNYYLDVSKKQANLLARPFSVQKEDEFIERMQKKQEEDAVINLLREKAFEENRRDLRERLMHRHNRMLELEQKSQIKLPFKPSQILTPNSAMNRSLYTSLDKADSLRKSQLSVTPHHSQNESNPESYSPIKVNSSLVTGPFGNNTSSHNLPGLSPTTAVARNLSFRSRFSDKNASTDQMATSQNFRAEHIENLSKPREKRRQPRNAFDRPEFQGMWARQMEEKIAETENVFAKDLKSKSNVLNMILRSARKAQKPTTVRGASRSTSMGFFKQFALGDQTKEEPQETESKDKLNSPRGMMDREVVLNDLDRFEIKVNNMTKMKGYPKIAFEAAIKLKDTEGFKQYIREKHVAF